MKKDSYLLILWFLLGIVIMSLTIGDFLLNNRMPTFESFILLHFAGYLFFLLMSVEGIYIYYLSEGLNWIFLLLLAIFTSFFAQVVDYMIGYILSEKVIEKLIGYKRYVHSRRLIDKYGKPIVFLFSLSPFSSPIILLITGMLKSDYRTIFTYSFLGLTVKYVIITMGYLLFFN